MITKWLWRWACGAIFLLAAAQATAAPPPQSTTIPSTVPTTQPTSAPSRFSINFKDMPLDSVLDYFSKTIGFQVLKEGNADGRITLISKQPVSTEEALTMLNAALKGCGLSVTREGPLLHIKTRDAAKKANPAVHFGNKPEDVADSDEIITQVIPVTNLNAVKLRDDLKPLIGPEADVAANDGSNSIIVTDSSSSVRRLVTIVAGIDAQEATTSELRIVQLKHANATLTAKLIESIFKSSAGGPEQPQPNMRGMMPGGQAPQPPGGAETGGAKRHGGTVIATADERTNTLLVMASTSTLKVVDEILEHLDADNPNPAPPIHIQSFPLKYADADATAKLINDTFKQPQGNQLPFFIFGLPQPEENKGIPVNAVADERTNTVVVSGPEEKLAETAKLVEQLDAQPMASQEIKVIHLNHADPDKIAKIIEDMFVPKKPEENPLGRIFFIGMPQEHAQPVTKVNVTSDTRTGSLMVSAPAGMLELIEKMAAELDSDASTEEALFIYRLRNGQSQHLEYTLNVLFGNITLGNQAPTQLQPGQQPGMLGPGMNNGINFNNGSSNSPNSNSNSRQRRNASTYNQRGAPNLSQSAQNTVNELFGQVLVVAEPDTNSLLVTTASKYASQVKAVIEELDRPVPQVLIKVLVAEVTHDNSLEMGADFSVLNERPNGKGQNLSGILGATAAAASATTPPGIVARIVETNLNATLQALAQANKLDVLSRPYILTSDNQDADITVGNKVPFVTSSFTDQTGGVHNTVQYEDIGIILDVTPHINPDGLVVMDVNPQISALTGETVTVEQGVSVPVFELRSASSRVAIKDSQTIVIGGLMQDQKTDNVSKIPLLGDIPLLGALFQYHSTDKKKTELLIFLTPHVVAQPERLQPMSNDEMQGTTLTPNAVEPGVFDEHMRGMQRGALPQSQPASSEPTVGWHNKESK